MDDMRVRPKPHPRVIRNQSQRLVRVLSNLGEQNATGRLRGERATSTPRRQTFGASNPATLPGAHAAEFHVERQER